MNSNPAVFLVGGPMADKRYHFDGRDRMRFVIQSKPFSMSVCPDPS